jgi:hypothetical protein
MLRAAMSRRSVALWLILMAMVFTLPALRHGPSGDDLVFAYKLGAEHPVKDRGCGIGTDRFGVAAMTLFEWLRPEFTQVARREGVLPWWTAPRAKLSFWRPLSAATHWLDYRLWPEGLALMRLHNALWFAAMLVVAWRLYRDIATPPWVAGLAALILAVNQENFQALAWIAARNSLISALFVALTLWLHRRHVERRSFAHGIGAVLALIAGLLAGEGAVATIAYLASYALCLDSRPWAARLRDLAGYVFVVIVWRAVYQALGFGVADSGLYLDPGTAPIGFALNAAHWMPMLTLDVLTVPILNRHAMLAPAAQPWAWGLALAAVALLGWAFRRLLRENRVARFWALGMVLALAPACATTVPDYRITLYAAIGFAPLVALFMAGAAGGAAWVPPGPSGRRTLLAVSLFLAAAHVVLPLAGHARRLARAAKPAAATGPFIPPALRAGPYQDLMVVNAPDPMWLTYYPYFLAADGAPLPLRMRMLTAGVGDLDVRRMDGNTLAITSARGPLIPAMSFNGGWPDTALASDLFAVRRISTAFRAESLAFTPGENVILSGLTATIVRVDRHGLPLELRFAFDRSLDDARFRWAVWDSRRNAYRHYSPPPVGGADRIPGLFAATSSVP